MHLTLALLVFGLLTAKSKNVNIVSDIETCQTECQDDSVKRIVYRDLKVFRKEGGVPPRYPGGNAALMRYLSKNVHYPEAISRDKIGGRVVVDFVVERDGTLSNIQIRESSKVRLLDKEALRVVSNMEKWIPGSKDGQNVRVKFHLPIVFRPR